MNKPMPVQVKSKEREMDYIIGDLESGDAKLVCEYVDLLRRQAQKAKNQRKTLRDLHKSHRAVIMENRWLREAIKGTGLQINGRLVWNSIVDQAKKSLWSQFRWLRSDEGPRGEPDRMRAMVDLGGHSVDEVMRNGAIITFHDYHGGVIFQGTWEELKLSLRMTRP